MAIYIYVRKYMYIYMKLIYISYEGYNITYNKETVNIN